MEDSGMESMMSPACINVHALNVNLMEEICHRDNLNLAYKRVVKNAGTSGIDGMTVEDLLGWLKNNGQQLRTSLLAGEYQPQAVKGVEIPKNGGGKGTRLLGVPTVIDRFIQQAILQIIGPIIDPTFSQHSYGFRAGRGAHQALNQAKSYVDAGYVYVADLDIEKFFDRVNHDMVMARLARHIGDKRVLRIIRRFLQAGMWKHGVFEDRIQGTPQGGPLSPLLANLLLDDLDKELEKRGHKFCRYADDCNIYVKSKAAAERVLESVSRFLANRLKLKVNPDKSAAAGVTQRTFLGYVIRRNAKLIASALSIERFKGRIRMLTRRNRGRCIEEVVRQVSLLIRGWTGYFKHDRRTSVYQDLDGWIRRRLRCYRLKQRKRTFSIARWLISLGIGRHDAWILAKSSKGWWRLSRTPQLNISLNNQWFADLGLLSMHKENIRLNT